MRGQDLGTNGGLYPRRIYYTHADGLPEGVQLSQTVAPIRNDGIGWTVSAVDETWNHVAVMRSVWSDPDGGPGHWVTLPGGEVDLTVCQQGGPRHPELDHKRFPDAETAMRAAWDAGLLAVTVFPARNERTEAEEPVAVYAEYETAEGYEGAAQQMDAAAEQAAAQGLRGLQESHERTAALYRRQAEVARRVGQKRNERAARR